MNRGGARAGLEADFRATSYCIETELGTLVLRIGQENVLLAEFLRRHGCRNWAIITAFNPGARRRLRDENENAQLSLTERLGELGLQHRIASNRADDVSWPTEPSLFVMSLARGQALQLCREFGQLACVCGGSEGVPELVWAE